MSHRGSEKRAAAVAFCVALCAAPSLARAQDTQGLTRDAAAVAQRERGIAQLRVGNVTEAIAAFEQSLGLVDSPNTHFDLGRAYFSAGRMASALRQFERARDDATARVQAGQLQYRLTGENAARAAEDLSPRVPRLVLRFSQPPPAGTTVRVDDENVPADALVAPVPVDPGTVSVSVIGPSVRPHTETRRVAAGDSTVVVLPVEPVGQLTVAVSPPIAGLEVRVDGRRLAPEEVGASLQLDPGDHRLEVTAPGMEPFAATRSVEVGASLRVEVQLTDGRAVDRSAVVASVVHTSRGSAETSPSSSSPLRMASYVAGAAGAAMLLTGAALWAYSDSEYNALVPQCVNGCTDRALASRADSAHAAETAGVTFMLVGGAAVAAGAVVWVLTRSHGEQVPTRAGLSASPGGLLVRF